jgi:cytochrome aa3-600 menaquinol oxidase subunit 1
MFGHTLNETLGKWGFWLFAIGFNLTFFPMYIVGLLGMTRRVNDYSADAGWTSLNFIETIGAYLMGIAFLVIVYNIYYSARYGQKDTTGDPWDGRTLEWSIPSPAPEYNFAHTPQITGIDSYWTEKHQPKTIEKKKDYKAIHMPNNSGQPFFMSLFFFIAGFGLVFEWISIAIIGAVGIAAVMFIRSFDKDKGYHIPAWKIKETEEGRPTKNYDRTT